MFKITEDIREQSHKFGGAMLRHTLGGELPKFVTEARKPHATFESIQKFSMDTSSLKTDKYVMENLQSKFFEIVSDLLNTGEYPLETDMDYERAENYCKAALVKLLQEPRAVSKRYPKGKSVGNFTHKNIELYLTKITELSELFKEGYSDPSIPIATLEFALVNSKRNGVVRLIEVKEDYGKLLEDTSIVAVFAKDIYPFVVPYLRGNKGKVVTEQVMYQFLNNK